MSSDEWIESGMSTFANVYWEPESGTESIIPLGLAKSTKSVTHGAEHAEDVVLRIIDDNLSLFAEGGHRNHLTFTLTKSPCTSTARPNPAGGGTLPTTSSKTVGCTEELIDLVTNGRTAGGKSYSFRLSIICRGLYTPSVAGATQGAVLAASKAAVDAMVATGHITISGDVRAAPSAARFEVE